MPDGEAGEADTLEERNGELDLDAQVGVKLSWRKTYREMAAEEADWQEWDALFSDGLDDI